MKRVLGRPTDPALTTAFQMPKTTYEEEEKKAEAEAAAKRNPSSDT